MIGAMVHGNPGRWSDALFRLRTADLQKIREQIPNYPYPDLLRALRVSVDTLEPEQRNRYLDFAVFPDKAAVPELALETLWEPEGLDQYDTHDLISLLVARSLLRRDERGSLTWHDLQLDFIRKEAGDPVQLHTRWLKAYWKRCPEGWASGPDDGYFYEHLAWHLAKAGQNDALYRLMDQAWMKARFARTLSHRAFAEDLEVAIEAAAKENPPNLLQHFKACFLHATLRSVSSEAPVASLEVLVRLGRHTPERLSEYVSQAMGYAALISWQPTRCEATRVIAKPLFDLGDCAGARAAFGEAINILEELEPDYQKVFELRDLAKTLGEIRYGVGLRRILAQVASFPEFSERIEAIAGISQAFAEMGDRNTARELARRGLEECRQNEGGTPDLALDIALCFAKAGERSEAVNCLNVALADARREAEANPRGEQ
jgi:tetratricopeptide (TPR) repeat protein